MHTKSLGSLLALPVIWGLYYMATNAAVSHMSVFSVGIVIRFLTMLLLTLFMSCRGQLKELLNVKHVWRRLILIGVLGFLLDVTAFIGLTLCPAGLGTVLLKCDILFVNLISMIFYNYRFSKRDWMYTFVMLAGVVFVMDIDFGSIEFGGIGNIFFILSALFVSINAFVIKSVQHDSVNPVSDNVVAYYNNFITLIFFIGFAGFSGDIVQLGKLGHDKYVTIALLLASLGQTFVYIVYYYNLRRFPVWIVKIFLLLMPIVVTVLSYFVFDETMSMNQYAGAAVVLAGAVGILAEQKKKNRKAVQNQVN